MRVVCRGIQKISENKSAKFIIPNIVFWEIGAKLKKKAIILPMDLKEYSNLVEKIPNTTIYNITGNDWINASEIDWDHKEPVDRVIVSVTVDKKYKLITKDETIMKSFDFAVW